MLHVCSLQNVASWDPASGKGRNPPAGHVRPLSCAAHMALAAEKRPQRAGQDVSVAFPSSSFPGRSMQKTNQSQEEAP